MYYTLLAFTGSAAQALRSSRPTTSPTIQHGFPPRNIKILVFSSLYSFSLLITTRAIIHVINSHLRNCGDKQALCAVRSNQVTFAAEEDKVDVGMNQLKLTCCNVPPPDKCSPVQQRRFIQTCDNKDSKNRKYCQFDAPLGVLLNSDGKNEDHVSFHQSVGYQPDQLNEALKKIIRQPDTSIKCQQENGQKVDCDKCWKASAGKVLLLDFSFILSYFLSSTSFQVLLMIFDHTPTHCGASRDLPKSCACLVCFEHSQLVKLLSVAASNINLSLIA